MNYKINNENWHICKICGKSIHELKKKYGGKGLYFTDMFIKHLFLDHNINTIEYFEKILDRPNCPCNVCNKKAKISFDKKSNFKWGYVCGRYEGTKKWSEEAKINRCGENNPMFNKTAWNKNKTAKNNIIIKNISNKLKNRIVSNSTKKKQSESAKKRVIHGHSGHKHSEENKEKFRINTLKMINDGKFKQNKTKPFLKMCEILQKLKLTFEEEKIVNYWSFDLYIPLYNCYIEVDGDYWHSNPKIYPNGPQTKTQKINYFRDIKKNKYCKENGLKIIRFWESNILNEEDKIIFELKELFQLNELV